MNKLNNFICLINLKCNISIWLLDMLNKIFAYKLNNDFVDKEEKETNIKC